MEKKIIEEVVIKRKKDLINKEKISQKIKNDLLNKKKKRVRDDTYLTAQKIVKDYRERQKSHAAFKRKIYKVKTVSNNFYDKSREGKPIMVIRISGYIERIAEEIKTILIKLKLKKLFSGIIMKYDKETFELLNLIDAYVTWGYVNKKNIADLIHKRGSVRDENGLPVQLQNDIIENTLGKFNIICLEDIVHELSVCGKNFVDIVNFIGFFLLSPTEEIKEKINIPHYKGGSQGFRGDDMNALLKKMI